MQAALTLCIHAPPCHQRCWLLNWMLITCWKVSLHFSPEDTSSRISNKNVKFGLFHFEAVYFKWALAPRTWWRFGTMFTYGFLFSFSWHLQIARQIAFTDSGFWKYSWAHLVISMTESCRWVMQCRLRPCPLRTEIYPVSSFDDVMHYRWWDLQSLCNLMLRNVVFKVFHNLFTHSFTD